MDSLADYTSDGENSNISEDCTMPYAERYGASRRASDANYDPVQMDMSEESNNNNSSAESGSERTNSPVVEHIQRGSRTDAGRSRSSSSDQRRSINEGHPSNQRADNRRDRGERSRYSDDKYRSANRNKRSAHDERRKESDYRDSRRSKDDERRSKDEDPKRRDKPALGSTKEDKTDDRDRNDRDYHHRDDRRDRDRDRRRDRERDRRHSRDDRLKDRHREDRSSYNKDKERTKSRSRSRSRDHAAPPPRIMSYREEKSRNKLAQLEKLGIELKPPENGNNCAAHFPNEQHFYNPLATATQGKYAQQIQKRKLLWANKSKPDETKPANLAAGAASTWVGTTFTHDQDGKVTAKFKRLMGIKGDLPLTPAPGVKPEILKKQEEMFNNMEQQYEVARATTHTQRGVGFGYATGGYQFPR